MDVTVFGYKQMPGHIGEKSELGLQAFLKTPPLLSFTPLALFLWKSAREGGGYIMVTREARPRKVSLPLR